MEKVVAGVVLRQALVGAQPDAPLVVLQHAVDHVADDAVAAVELADEAVLRELDEPRAGAAVEPRGAAAAQAEQVAQRAVLQAVHVDERVALRAHVEADEAVAAAQAQQQRRVALADQGVELVAVAPPEAEAVAAHGRRDGPLAPGDGQLDQRVAVAGQVERRVVDLTHLVHAPDLLHARLHGQAAHAVVLIGVVGQPGPRGAQPHDAVRGAAAEAEHLVAREPRAAVKARHAVGGHTPARIGGVVAQADHAVALGADPQVAPGVGMEGPHGLEHPLRHVVHEQRGEALLLVAVFVDPVAVGTDPQDLLVAVGQQAEDAVVGGDQLAAAAPPGHAPQRPGQETHVEVAAERADGRDGMARLAQLREVGEQLRLAAARTAPQPARRIDEEERPGVVEGLAHGTRGDPARRHAHQWAPPAVVETVADQLARAVQRAEGAGPLRPHGDDLGGPHARHADILEEGAAGTVARDEVVAREEHRAALLVGGDVLYVDILHVALHHAPLAQREPVDPERRGHPQMVAARRHDLLHDVAAQRELVVELHAEDEGVLAVVEVQAVVGADPHVGLLVLVDRQHGVVGQLRVGADERPRRKARRQQQGRRQRQNPAADRIPRRMRLEVGHGSKIRCVL